MSLQALIDDALARTPSDRPVWIALSGGLDSSTLLYLAVQAARRDPRSVYALHVHHGLQAVASDFERHCRFLCSRLGVPLFVERVQIELAGRGLEAAAREARYDAFARRVAPGDTLWLAQHCDDQAETFLLAALRSSGTRGLAGMPSLRHWQGRRLERPLLTMPRAELLRVAQRCGFAWVEDPSNTDEGLDRNYLRRRVLPLLEARWPHAARALARSAELMGESDTLLGELAAQDLAEAGDHPGRLALAALRRLSLPRRRLLIRHALVRLGLALPPAARLETLLEQLDAATDAEVRVTWPGGEARCWRQALYLLSPLSPIAEDWREEWDGATPIVTPLGPPGWRISRADGCPSRLTLGMRRGGERIRLAGRGSRDLKRLLQEQGVPPWQRERLLLVWERETLVAVLGVAVAEGWRMTCMPFPAEHDVAVRHD
ncbi:tRNA lysidine(34) synthetase TilS [Halomonas shantousis]